jgi:hypothetical protein
MRLPIILLIWIWIVSRGRLGLCSDCVSPLSENEQYHDDAKFTIKKNRMKTKSFERKLLTTSQENIPYGISITQGSTTRGFPRLWKRNVTTFGNCWDITRSFRVLILDTGVDVSHPDLPCLRKYGVRCVGTNFVSTNESAWDQDTFRLGGKHGCYDLVSLHIDKDFTHILLAI